MVRIGNRDGDAALLVNAIPELTTHGTVANAYNVLDNSQLSVDAAETFYSLYAGPFGKPLNLEPAIAELLGNARENATPTYIGNEILKQAMDNYRDLEVPVLDDEGNPVLDDEGNERRVPLLKSFPVAQLAQSLLTYYKPSTLDDDKRTRLIKLIEDNANKRIFELDDANEDERALAAALSYMGEEVIKTKIAENLHHYRSVQGLEQLL